MNITKLAPTDDSYDSYFWWVAHEDGGPFPEDSLGSKLVNRRYEIEILGGISDRDASYSYDDWALCRLDGDHYLLATSGCSCPSPSETWHVEIGPCSLSDIRDHVTGGHYAGYTVPKKQEDEFLELINYWISQEKGSK